MFLFICFGVVCLCLFDNLLCNDGRRILIAGELKGEPASAGVPIVTGEEGICKGCGIATLSIDYYELGKTTGAMAAKILTGEANVSEMPIEYYQNPVKKYDVARCEALGITVPADYVAIG